MVEAGIAGGVRLVAGTVGGFFTLFSASAGGKDEAKFEQQQRERDQQKEQAPEPEASADGAGARKGGGRGKAPTGDDGHPMELHHEGQNPEGPVKEMTRTEHRGGENFKKNHQNTGQQPSKIDRPKFRKFREQYWKNKPNK